MVNLWFQTCYLDTNNDPQRPETAQAPRERATVTLSRHVGTTVPAALAANPQGSGASPNYQTPSGASGTLKTSEHVDSSGKRHFTITTQQAGESPQQWQDRHDAAHALLVAAFP